MNRTKGQNINSAELNRWIIILNYSIQNNNLVWQCHVWDGIHTGLHPNTQDGNPQSRSHSPEVRSCTPVLHNHNSSDMNRLRTIPCGKVNAQCVLPDFTEPFDSCADIVPLSRYLLLVFLDFPDTVVCTSPDLFACPVFRFWTFWIFFFLPVLLMNSPSCICICFWTVHLTGLLSQDTSTVEWHIMEIKMIYPLHLPFLLYFCVHE